MKIAIVYNTSQYLVRFRSELINLLVSQGHDVIAICPHDSSTQALLDLGVTWINWKLEGQSLNPLKDIVSIIQLCIIFVRSRPEALLNFTIKPLLYSSIFGLLVSRIRSVSVITGLGNVLYSSSPSVNLPSLLAKLIYPIALRCNKSILCQNDDDIAFIVGNNCAPLRKIKKINGSGVNLDLFRPSNAEFAPASFLLVSRMIKQKGIYEFVEAARLVRQQFPKASFTLVGPIDSNPSSIPKSKILDWVNEDLINYIGPVSDIRQYMASSEVYVLPSYYPEGIPRSILEALAMAKPVITTDWRGCRECVVDGSNGFLVQPKDSQALAAAMIKFIVDPTLSSVFSRRSRSLAEAKFDVDAVNKVILGEILS
jgi:glycosyltransferase involved in cell wall biosynthesis